MICGALRSAYGPRRYRITKGGEIHVYGRMPNTNITGWWVFGDLHEQTTIRRLQELT